MVWIRRSGAVLLALSHFLAIGCKPTGGETTGQLPHAPAKKSKKPEPEGVEAIDAPESSVDPSQRRWIVVDFDSQLPPRRVLSEQPPYMTEYLTESLGDRGLGLGPGDRAVGAIVGRISGVGTNILKRVNIGALRKGMVRVTKSLAKEENVHTALDTAKRAWDTKNKNPHMLTPMSHQWSILPGLTLTATATDPKSALSVDYRFMGESTTKMRGSLLTLSGQGPSLQVKLKGTLANFCETLALGDRCPLVTQKPLHVVTTGEDWLYSLSADGLVNDQFTLLLSVKPSGAVETLPWPSLAP